MVAVESWRGKLKFATERLLSLVKETYELIIQSLSVIHMQITWDVFIFRKGSELHTTNSNLLLESKPNVTMSIRTKLFIQ